MSKKYLFSLPLIGSLVVPLGVVVYRAWWVSPTPAPEHASTGTPGPTPTPLPEWILIQGLPPDASQADIGAEIYRLVCQDCHGDRGQGLTPEWISTWAPEDQNCWKSKCHATNHPPEGFVLPRVVPAIAGAGALLQFNTVLDLYHYIKESMPWYAPGSLREDQVWQVTAHLVRMNRVDPATIPLDAGRAAALFLHSNSSEQLPQGIEGIIQTTEIPNQGAQATPLVPDIFPQGESTQDRAPSYGLAIFISVVTTLIVLLIAFRLGDE